MARGELLRKLFLNQGSQDSEKFRAIALQIIAEEKQKKNNQLAVDLLNILENKEQKMPITKKTADFQSLLPKDKDREAFLVDVRNPESKLNDIILSENNEKIIKRAMLEYRKSDLLKVHGLKPRSKFLFCGPPGCGKTLCADVIAHELDLPLMYVHFDAVVSSYLGETAANLRKIFDYASQGRWVLFFDEFDAIGKSRDDPSEHGELKRVINSFLQLLDGFYGPSIIISATNHEGILDPALWRRFDEIIRFEQPSQSAIQKLITKNIKNFPHKNIGIKNKSIELKGMSHAAIERVCMNSIKACVIENKDYITSSIFEQALVAFDIQTGKTRWESTVAIPRGRTDLERIVDIDGLFVTQDKVIYVSTYQGRIAAVSAEDGGVIWTRDMSSWAGISMKNGLVCVSDADGYIWGLDRKTGATLWRQDKLKDRDLSAPVIMDGAVVVADRGGYVHWLSLDDGGFIAREDLKQVHADAFINWGDSDEDEPDYGVSIFPSVSGNALLIRSNMGDLALFQVTPPVAPSVTATP